MYKVTERIYLVAKIVKYMCNISIYKEIRLSIFIEQLKTVGPESIFIIAITSFFISLVFTLQIVKEFLYLNAADLIGSILSLSFIHELSPVLTSIVIIGKIGSYFTSELATMVLTEQIDALYMLGINPIDYLIIPRILSVVLILPLLNLFSILTSVMSSSFTCFILYNIHPQVFFISVYTSFSFIDIFKSSLKIMIFGFCISIISCVFGVTTRGGSKGVGLSTTSSVVVSLLFVFVLDFLLSYLMFNDKVNLIKI
uniref:ABC transporter permease n=1 Tax=Cliftonaea pectinata TaxID=2007206 RepID=A0A1Z1MQA9_9FLOR|nr:hypothetical protein [Cliftonaea pectinata]ARW68042.1 hypothetical protein [Cliftonaea pectinata]